MIRRLLTVLVVLLGTYQLGAQSAPPSVRRESTQPNRAAAEIRISGAGATTIYPLLSAWIDEYHRRHPEIRISYQAIGSGGGIRQLIAGTVSFAVTQVPMSDEQLAKASGRILHLPVTLDAVVPLYNLTQVSNLRFSGNTLAGIFLGKITRWDDTAIASDNPSVALPRMDIKVVHLFPHRDPAASLMADYLSKTSPAFKTTLEKSDGMSWPLPTGMAGYRGGGWNVATVVHEVPGSIGCADLLWARKNYLKHAAVKNFDGEFVIASLESVAAASASEASSIQTKAPDFRLSITNRPGKMVYPVSSFMWLLMYDDDKDQEQHRAMVDFLKWILTDGQRLAPELGYPALPSDLVQIELQLVGTGEKQ